MKKLILLAVLCLCASVAYGQGSAPQVPVNVYLLNGPDANGVDSVKMDELGRVYLGLIYMDSARWDSVYNRKGDFSQGTWTYGDNNDTAWIDGELQELMRIWESGDTTEVTVGGNSRLLFSAPLVVDSIDGLRVLRGRTGVTMHVTPGTDQVLDLNYGNDSDVRVYTEGTSSAFEFREDSLVGATASTFVVDSIGGATVWDGATIDDEKVDSITPFRIKQEGASSGQVLKWSDGNGRWQPGTDLASGAGDDVKIDTAGDGTGIVDIGDFSYRGGTNVSLAVNAAEDTVYISATDNNTQDTIWAMVGDRDTTQLVDESGDTILRVIENTTATRVETYDNTTLELAPAAVSVTGNLSVTGTMAVGSGGGTNFNGVSLTGVESIEPEGNKLIHQMAADDTTLFVFTDDTLRIVNGAVTKGEWQGTAVANAYIGTDISLSKLEQDGATTGQVMKWDGVDWAPDDESGAAAGGWWDTIGDRDIITYVGQSDTLIKVSEDNDSTIITPGDNPHLVLRGTSGTPIISFNTDSVLDSALFEAILLDVETGGGAHSHPLTDLTSAGGAIENSMIRYDAGNAQWEVDSINGGTGLHEVMTDAIGAMVSGNTETNITVDFRDADNTFDFDVPHTALDDVQDPDASKSFTMGAYTGTFTSATDGWSGMIISNTVADLTATTNLLTLSFTDDGDVDGRFLECTDNAGDTKLMILEDGRISTLGSVTAASLVVGAASISEAELEILDGATVTTAELNILDGVTATYTELNLLDGVTSTTAELNYTDGVTSAIQTQLDAKEGTLANEAGLYSALSDVTDFLQENDIDASSELLAIMDDETGTGALVFGTSPTFTTGITVPNNSISDEELDEGANFTWTGAHDYTSGSLEIPHTNSPTTDAEGEYAHDDTDNALEGFDGSVSYFAAMKLKTCQATIYDPDNIQGTADAIPILAVETEAFPHGITIVDCGIKLDDNTVTYALNFEEWTSPSDGAPSTIETVTATSAYEAADDGTIDDGAIAAGSIVYIDLDTDDIDYLQIWFTYYINDD